MSRVAIYNAIVSDTALNALGIDATTTFANYSLDERPTDSGPFVILRWQNEFYAHSEGRLKGPRQVIIWAHYPIEVSSDHADLDQIFNALDNVLLPMGDVAGLDGLTVRNVRSINRSEDLKDEGFQTITRNATYEVLSS